MPVMALYLSHKRPHPSIRQRTTFPDEEPGILDWWAGLKVALEGTPGRKW